MTQEEFGWWCVMLEEDWIGWHRQARLLAHVAAGVRSGPLKHPGGESTTWTAQDFIAPNRWDPPPPKSKVVSRGPGVKAITDFFSRFGK